MAWFNRKAKARLGLETTKRTFKSWRPSLEVLEDRTVPFVLDPGTWGAGATVFFSFMPNGINDGGLDGGWNSTAINNFMPAGAQNEIRRALQQWSRLANINFVEIADPGVAFGAEAIPLIRIGGHPFDGPSNVLAHCFYPPATNPLGIAGDAHFDIAENWTLDNSGISVFQVAMHEFGHGIGLRHENTNPALMNPFYPGEISAVLDDVQGVQAKYGAAQIANLVVSAADDPAFGNQAGDGIGDTFRFKMRGGVLDVLINGNFAYSVNAATLTSITINGSGDNDTVIVDQTGGWVNESILFNGFGQTSGTFGDTLRFEGGNFNTVTYTFTNAHDGFVNVDGAVLQYAGLEPIFDNMNVANRVFTFNNNSSDITLQNDIDQPGGPFAGWSQISSVSDSEIVFFTNATNSLTVNAGDGDDVISVFPTIDPNYNTPNTFINGDAGEDRVFVQRVAAGTNVNVDTGLGVPVDDTYIGIGKNDLFNAGVGTLANILGNVNVEDSGGVGRLFIDNSADVAGMNFFIDAIGAVPVFGGPGFRVNPVLLPGFINFTDDIERFELATGDGSELVEFDFNGNNIASVLPDQGIFVDLNGGNNDLLRFVDGNSNDVTYFADNNDGNLATHEGRVVFDGIAVAYAGLEPIIDTTFANNRTFTLNIPNPQEIQVHNDGIVGNGINRIDTNGTGGFEQIDFSNPFNSLTINGNNAVNRMFLRRDFDTNFAPNFITFNGFDGNDFFYMDPPQVLPPTTIFVNGGNPQIGDPGVPPGDVLVVPIPGAVVVPTGSVDGTVFTPVGPPIVFTSIETVIVPDRFEFNNTIQFATFLGSDPFITLRDLSIHSVDDPNTLANEADIDYFRYSAHQTGYTVFEIQFRNGVDVFDDLVLELRDENDNVIAATQTIINDPDGTRIRLITPTVGQRNYYVRVSGLNGQAVNNYSLEIENFPLPTPTSIDLIAASDSGRNNTDDVTNDNTPSIIINADLSGLAQFIPILNAAGAAARDRGAAVQVFLDGVSVGFANAVPGTNNTRFEFTLPAGFLQSNGTTDGIHSFTAAVRIWDGRQPQATNFSDRGQMSPAFFWELDTIYTPPNGAAVSTTVVLNPADDTGVPTDPATFNDRVTRINAPRFNGFADANAWVVIRVDGQIYGQAQAIPIDGNVANPIGFWTLSAGMFPLTQGLHTVTAQAQDLAGNTENITALNTVQIFVDYTSPQVDSVFGLDIDGNPVGLDLLIPKQPGDGRQPAVWGLQIDVSDLPPRAAGFLYEALNDTTVNAQNVVLRGARTGLVTFATISWVSDPVVAGNPATGHIVITFGAPLQDDTYTLELKPAITDDPGNPIVGPAGGVFTFVVDAAPEFGTYAGGSINIDLNGNFHSDSNLNGDVLFRYVANGAAVFAGQFTSNEVKLNGFGNDFFDRVGLYGRYKGKLVWMLDVNNNGIINPAVDGDDIWVTSGLQKTGTPIAGDFNYNPDDGQEIGLFDGKTWYLDVSASNNLFNDARTLRFTGNMRGLPIIGDFDGDGNFDLGTFLNNRFYLDLSSEGGSFGPLVGINGNWDVWFDFGFPTKQDRPYAADFDGDGITDIGLWTPGRSTQTAAAKAEWFTLVSAGTPIYLRNPFGPVDFFTSPFAQDFSAAYGNPKALPIVGNFDPPGVAGTGNVARGESPNFDMAAWQSLGADGYFAKHGWRKNYGG